MSAIEFTAPSGKTFVIAEVRDPSNNYTLLASSISATEITAFRYRASLGSLSGLVWIKATAGATSVVGFADLENPDATTGHSEVYDVPPVDVSADVNAIRAKTDLIGTGQAFTNAMVSPAGRFAAPIAIGDDYLASNSRAFEWTIDPIVGFVRGDVVVRIGFKMRKSCGTVYSFSGSGSVLEVGDKWKVRCELTDAAAGQPPGMYDWSVELSVGSVEITRIQNLTDATRVRVIEKQT